MNMILTNLGEELTSNGFLTGVFPKITKVMFGDGNGSMVTPDKAMTNLVHYIQDGIGTTVARLGNPNRLYLYTQIPTTVGGFTIREVGLFTDDNVLIAIGGNFEKVKPPVSESVEKFDFYITLPLSSTQDITVQFSNDNLYADQSVVDVLQLGIESNRLEILTKAKLNGDTTKNFNVADATSDFNAINKKQMDLAISKAVPTGTIIEFAAPTVPNGYIECNGAALSRTAYAALFAVVGTIWGAGDGSTTFNIIDKRGKFSRGWDHGAGIDSGRVFGSDQDSQNKSHTHTASTDSSGDHKHTAWTDSQGYHNHIGLVQGSGGAHAVTNVGDQPIYIANGYTSAAGAHGHNIDMTTTGAHTHNVTVNTSGGNETRPINTATLFCIKY